MQNVDYTRVLLILTFLDSTCGNFILFIEHNRVGDHRMSIPQKSLAYSIVNMFLRNCNMN